MPSSISTDPCHRVADALRRLSVVMTLDRRKVMIDSFWIRSNATRLHYAQASDGVWVPVCDLKQYESGKRPFRI